MRPAEDDLWSKSTGRSQSLTHLELLVRKNVKIHVRLSYPRLAATEYEAQRALDSTKETFDNSNDETFQATNPLSGDGHLVRFVVLHFFVACRGR